MDAAKKAVREVVETYGVVRFVVALSGGRWLTLGDVVKAVGNAIGWARYALAMVRS